MIFLASFQCELPILDVQQEGLIVSWVGADFFNKGWVFLRVDCIRGLLELGFNFQPTFQNV